MQKFLLAGAFATSLMLPCAGHAQPAPASQPRAQQSSEFSVVPWIAVGAVVAGALLFDTIIPDEIAYLAIGAVGGYLATVWYNGGQLEFRTTSATR